MPCSLINYSNYFVLFQKDENMARNIRDGGGRGESVRRGGEDDVREPSPHQLRIQRERGVFVVGQAPVGDSDGEAAEMPHHVSQNG